MSTELSLTFLPEAPLSDFIACIWFTENYLPPHSKEYALPDGSVEVIFNLREDRLAITGNQQDSSFEYVSGSLVYGPHTEVFTIDTSAATSILGIHFKPGGAFPFFGVPADELQNRILPLDLFFGSQMADLRGHLIDAQSVTKQFKLLQAFLKAQLTRPLMRHPAVDFALRSLKSAPNTHKVADIHEQIGLSSRRLSLVFREQVGMTPKAFHRLQRFQSVLPIINQAEEINWVDLALSCGYFDQAHFIHDFKAFSNLTPLEYKMQAGKRPGHVPATA